MHSRGRRVIIGDWVTVHVACMSFAAANELADDGCASFRGSMGVSLQSMENYWT